MNLKVKVAQGCPLLVGILEEGRNQDLTFREATKEVVMSHRLLPHSECLYVTLMQEASLERQGETSWEGTPIIVGHEFVQGGDNIKRLRKQVCCCVLYE